VRLRKVQCQANSHLAALRRLAGLLDFVADAVIEEVDGLVEDCMVS